MIMRTILLLFLLSGLSQSAFAGPIEVLSIQIDPAETTKGIHPEIKCTFKVNKVPGPGPTMDLIVIAAVVRPDHVVKSWTWKNVNMKKGETRSISLPKEYEVKLPGSYRVDFNVYSKDMHPLHRLSNSFVVTDPSKKPVKPIATKKDTAGGIASPSARVTGTEEYPHVGIGIYSNTVNLTGGATILLWPFKHIGLQGSYTAGEFTIMEGRLLARFPLESGINPYLGVGYINVSKEDEVIGIKTKFQDSGVSGVVGVEIPLSKNIFGYVELGGAKIDLQKDVTSGSLSAHATIEYVPVTIGLGIVFFAF